MMRKIILGFILFITIGFGLVSCKDFRENLHLDRALVGQWESVWSEGWHEDAGGRKEWSENIAGKMQATYDKNGRGIDSNDGAFGWEVAGDVISIYYIRNPNTPAYFRILEISESSLVLEDAYSDTQSSHSERITFRKVY